MGYELKMRVGWLGRPTNEMKREAKVTHDDNGDCYHSYVKDEKGNFEKTGRTESYFIQVAEIDLCKVGYSATGILASNSMRKKDNKAGVVCKWFESNKEISEDCYGDMPTPISISEVIKTLKKDTKSDNYRRFKWALSLLNTIASTNDEEDFREFIVLFYGH